MASDSGNELTAEARKDLLGSKLESTNRRLRDNISALHNEIRSLKTQRDAADMENSRLRAEIEEMQSKMNIYSMIVQFELKGSEDFTEEIESVVMEAAGDVAKAKYIELTGGTVEKVGRYGDEKF